MNNMNMKLLSALLRVLLVTLVAFSGVSCSASKSQGDSTAQYDYEKRKSQAVKEFPDDLPSIALHNLSKKEIDNRFSTEEDPKIRARNAASIFMGFYNINTRGFSEYCGEYNVDIEPFVTAFKARHIKEYKKAIAIRKSTPEFEEGQYNAIRTQLRSMAEQHMKDIASMHKTTVARACELVILNAHYLAEETHISKMQPVVYAELTNAE